MRLHALHALHSDRRRSLLLAHVLGLAAWTGPVRAALASLVDDDVATAVFEAVMPSVVSLTDFRMEGREVVEEGVGSGVVWDRRGHIITNYHCVARLAKDTTGQEATEVALTSARGGTARYRSCIIGVDPEKDLAVLRIDAPAADLQPIKVGTSGDLKVVQTAFAIGFPARLSYTLTAGVVSGLNRAIPSPGGTLTGGAIQAAGVPTMRRALLDSGGRLIGLSTATFTRKKQGARSSGVNFAIGVDVVRECVPRLIVYGSSAGVRAPQGEPPRAA